MRVLKVYRRFQSTVVDILEENLSRKGKNRDSFCLIFGFLLWQLC